MDTYEPVIMDALENHHQHCKTNVTKLLPESYYILRAIMRTIEQLQTNIGQTIAVGALLSKPETGGSIERQQDAWGLMLDLIYKSKTYGDALELTIQDELQRFEN